MMSQVMCSLALKYLMRDANVDAVRLYQILINNDRHEGGLGHFKLPLSLTSMFVVRNIKSGNFLS